MSRNRPLLEPPAEDVLAPLPAEVATLLVAARDLAATLELRPLLELLLDHLNALVGYVGTAILVLEGDELVFAGIRNPDSFTWDDARRIRYPVAGFCDVCPRLCSGEVVIIPDVRGEGAEAEIFCSLVGRESLESSLAFIRACMWVPLVVRDRLIGLLSITSSAPNAYTQREAELAQAIGRQAAVAVENARLHQRAGQAAVLEERQRLARELHDSVTQSLYSIALYAESARRALADGHIEPATDTLHDIGETTQEALGEMRLLLFELRPPHLDEHGLAGALRSRLQAVEARAGLKTEFDCQGEGRLAPETEQELFRLAQEALNNVLKHAHARHVCVRLDLTGDQVVVEVADDGMGFEPSSPEAEGYGLPGMRERAERLGGTVEIDSGPGAGTRVRVEVPR